jgi:hypothetical protein
MLGTPCSLDEVDTPENRPPTGPGWPVEGALDGGDRRAAHGVRSR